MSGKHQKPPVTMVDLPIPRKNLFARIDVHPALVLIPFGNKWSRDPLPVFCVSCSFLALVSVALNDRENAVEATYRIVDTFIRYPGLGRFVV